MKRSVPRWQLAGFLFTGILGTFLHFLFDLTGGSPAAALVSAVNESIWEHMKLLYYPMMLFALAEYRFWGKNTPGFWCRKLGGIALGLALIPVVYYTYTGIGGTNADWFNITIFFLAALVSFRMETRWFLEDRPCPISEGVALILLGMIAAAFTALTFYPPRIPFFRDPVTGTYGFWKT